jgi:hypothetical protein
MAKHAKIPSLAATFSEIPFIQAAASRGCKLHLLVSGSHLSINLTSLDL